MLKKLQHMFLLNTTDLLTDSLCDSGLALIVLVQLNGFCCWRDWYFASCQVDGVGEAMGGVTAIELSIHNGIGNHQFI